MSAEQIALLVIVIVAAILAVFLTRFIMRRFDVLDRERQAAIQKYMDARTVTNDRGEKVWVPLPGDSEKSRPFEAPPNDASGWGGIDLPPGHYP